MSFQRLFITLAALFSTAVAFTVAPQATQVRGVMPLSSADFAPVASSSTSLSMQVDPAIAEMMAKSPPIGSVIMLVLVIGFWELSGRTWGAKN